ncbi:hypothetical protein F8M41_011614 [Gigaspora margarita]|uniref:Uncharacterized protein n=1 Tax=Gigaspora margarita TaxID=4874 RepID=A0A8H4ATP5_GIGMA|nr:hypothetical protein F8M41_011614 [Gigaspora margarita]
MSVGIDMPTFQSSTSEDVPILIDDNFNDTVRPTTPPFQSSIGIEKNIPPPINNEYDAKGQTPFTSFMNRRNTPPLINNEYDSKGQNFFTSFRNTPSLNNNEYDSKEQNTYASFMNRKNAPPLINNEYDSKEQNIFASMMSRKNTPPLINNDNEYDAKEQNTLTPFIMKNTPPLINNEYDPKERNTLASFMNRKNTPPLINNEKYDSKEKDTSASFLDGDFQLHQPYQPLKPYKPKLKPDQPQPKLYQPQFSDFPKESSTGIVNATNNEYDFKKHNIFLKYKNKYDSKEKSSSASFLDGDSQPHLKMKFKPLQRPAPNRRNPPKEPSTGVVNAAKNWGKKT